MGLKWILAACCLLVAAELALSQNVGDYIIPTSGGNGNGEACVFPFLYRNQTYTNCTMDRHTKLWCAVTSNYDVDPQWGNCNYTAAYFYTEPASTSTASTPESTGCTVSFDKQENTFAFGGNPVPGVDNEDECKQQCQDDDACLGLDFNTNTNMCYHFSDERVNDGQEGEGTNHYIKVPCTSTAMPSTTVSTTAGDGSCVDTFTEFTNRWIQGGVEQQGVTTKEDCESECLNNENCYAYEFTSRNLCYHHNDPDVVGQDLNVGSNDVNHYVRIRCAPSTTTGSTDSSPTSPTPTECEDSYERLQRTWARGGQQQTNIETSAECIDLCTANPNCTALDFNPTSNIKCYLFLHDIPTPIPDDSSPVTHFVRQRCGEDTTTPTGTASTTVTGTTEDICVFVYEVLNSTAFFGGAEQVDASNLGLCQDACNNNENCVSFDYNHGVTVSGPRCYLHLDGTGQQYISNTTYHYIKTPCPDTASTSPQDGCTDTFEKFENFFSYGGVRVSGLNTKEKCEAECLSHPIDECLGFDFTASLECFIHNDTSKFEDGRNMVDNTEVEVTQYIRKECATTGATTGTGPTPCLDIFERTEKTQSFGGTDQPDVDGIEACKTRCLEIEDCLGFDYNVAGSGTKCFTYTDEAKFEETFSADSIDRYTRMPDPACITTTTGGPPDGCKDTFTETENTFAYDGIDLPDDRTLDDCKETCRGVETCVGINYSPDSAGTRCYWFNDTAVFNRDQTGEGVSKYTRVSCKTTVTDTTLPPTGPTCNNVWTQFENQGDFGATEVPGANTLAMCQQNCIDDPDCKSIEVTNTNQCFKYSRDVNLQPRANITSYKLDRCVSSPGPTQPCLDEYIAIPNTHAPGGTKSDQETPEAEDCQRVCSTTEGCKAVDFTPSKECWLHFRETNVTGFFQGATHYILFRECDGATTLKPTPGTDPTRITGPTTEPTPDCVPTWEERRDVNSFDGVEEPTAFTREACQSACAKNPECVALDYNDASPIRCYLHLDIGNLDTTRELIGNVQYVLIDRCPQVTETTLEQCQPEWLETKDVHVLGGQDANPPANTEDMCKQRCIDEPTCVAIDFDTRNLKCFIMPTTGSFRTAAGTNHYDLQQRCTTSGSTVTLPGGCQDQFTVSVNRHLNGGEEVEGSTVEICKQACSRDPECTSVDFNRLNNECYVHTISNPNLQVADGIDNYVIERCTSTTATPNPCPDTFEQFANQHSRGGTNQADSVDTLQKCKDECSSQANCLALDFVKTGGNAPCWLHFSSGYMNTRASNNDIDQYVITRCSETTTTSTTTTTTATTQAGSTVTTGSTPQIEDPDFPTALFVSRTGGTIDAQREPLPLDSEQVDYDNRYRNSEFTAPQYGYYFYHWTVGLTNGVGATVQLKGVDGRGLVRRSTTHSSTVLPADMMSRSSIGYMNTNQKMWLSLDEGKLYTDTMRQTSLTVFSISDTMVENRLFIVSKTSESSSTGKIDFDEMNLNGGYTDFDINASEYICPTDGHYVFSFSTGVRGGRTISMALTGSKIRTVGLERFSSSHNDIDVISRQAFLYCEQGERLYLDQRSGSSYSDVTYKQTAFTGFKFDPKRAPQIGFSAYKSTSFGPSTSGMDPCQFDIVEINVGGAFQNNRFVAPETGYYYFYFSAGVMANQHVGLRLVVNGSTYAALQRMTTTHNGSDTMGRGVIVYLSSGNEVRLAVDGGTALYANNLYPTSFFGFMLYRA